jgi:ribonuclease P protein component
VVHANSTDTRAGQPPRVGFVVSKAVGNAVVRNRTKRVLRHVMAARLDRVPAGTDLVVRANPPAAGAGSRELGADVDRLMSTVLRRLERAAQS